MTDDEIRGLFDDAFINPDDAGMPLDDESETDAYFWTRPRVETEDALAEVAPEASPEQLERLAAELNEEYPAWVRRSDL